MTKTDLIARIADHVGRELPLDGVGHERAVRAITAAVTRAVPPPEEVTFPGVLLTPACLSGRVRLPEGAVAVNRGVSGGIRLRLDSGHDDSFWMEAVVPDDVLLRLGYVKLVDD
jgi:hypothetical protein